MLAQDCSESGVYPSICWSVINLLQHNCLPYAIRSSLSWSSQNGREFFSRLNVHIFFLSWWTSVNYVWEAVPWYILNSPNFIILASMVPELKRPAGKIKAHPWHGHDAVFKDDYRRIKYVDTWDLGRETRMKAEKQDKIARKWVPRSAIPTPSPPLPQWGKSAYTRAVTQQSCLYHPRQCFLVCMFKWPLSAYTNVITEMIFKHIKWEKRYSRKRCVKKRY